MLIIISSILSLIIFTLITAPLCLVSALPNSAPALHRRGPTFYQAQGDSYAAGLGSGIYMTRASRCQQYTESYPNMLNGLINNGENITPENHQACAGATAEDIIKNQRMDPIANVVTISVGLEHINFINVINDCVYMFSGRKSGNCDDTISSTMDHLESQLAGEVRKTVENALEGDKVPNFQLYLLGLARFWNAETDQCDRVSWNYWQDQSPLHSGGETMTKDRRRNMNGWIRKVNEILDAVISTFHQDGENRVQFVNYDDAFDGHRFCEEMYLEPQRNDEARPDAYFFQYQTPRGQLWALNEMAAAVGPAATWTQAVPAVREESPQLQVSEYYTSQPIDLTRPFSNTVPIFMSKIFHPTPVGHWEIAAALKAAIDATNAPEDAAPPSPRAKRASGLIDTEAACGEELSLNFPHFFVVDDGRVPVSQILLRLSDQACRGVCDAVPGIPRHLIEWQTQYGTGCEYAVKIGPVEELYFFASDSGDNCLQAAKLMIEQCMTEKDLRTRLRSTGLINGPNQGESYSIGVRPMNAPGSNHAAFPNKTDEHLPYMQLSCMGRELDHSQDAYTIQAVLWDDGEDGASVGRMIRKVFHQKTHRLHLYKADDGFKFLDGTPATHRIYWHMREREYHHPEAALTDLFHLEPGSMKFELGVFYDVPVFKDWNYDTDWGFLPGIGFIMGDGDG